MTDSPPLGKVRRGLLAVGTARYNDSAFTPLNRIPAALARIVEACIAWDFTPVASDSKDSLIKAVEEIGLHRLPSLADPPGFVLDPDLNSLQKYLRVAGEEVDVLVFFYTGHGVKKKDIPYRIVTRDSDHENMMDSALEARTVPARLTSSETGAHRPTVLVILDCCFSGNLARETILDAIGEVRSESAWLIVSAGRVEYARQGVFAEAFAQALGSVRAGPSTRYIPLEMLRAIAQSNIPPGYDQHIEVVPPGGVIRDEAPFFPNREWQPALAGLSVSSQEHWLSVVRGLPDYTEATAFYLVGQTGRVRAAEIIAEWLADRNRSGLAVVTGSPGSGKSTLLGLLVLMASSDATRSLLMQSSIGSSSMVRAVSSRLAAGSEVGAIHARGLTNDQIAGEIGRLSGVQADGVADLLENIGSKMYASSESRPIVVVDAVDEAATPISLFRSLLRPIVDSDLGLKLVVGVRGHLLVAAGQIDLEVDLDSENFQDPDALTDYATSILLAAHETGVITPYQSHPRGTVRAVGQALALHATTRHSETKTSESFLLTRLLAMAVRGRSQVMDPSDIAVLEALPSSVAQAFDEDLTHRLGDRSPFAMSLLAPLAWARGSGLPFEEIWLPLAVALTRARGHTHALVESDIRWALEKLGSYLVESPGQGNRSVYRPFHDLLSRHLKEWSVENLPVEGDGEANELVEGAITMALRETVPKSLAGDRPDWLRANPYVRTYIGEHARAAGLATFTDLVRDPDFLAVADPVRLTRLFPRESEPPLSRIGKAYRRARPLLGLDPRQNASLLREAFDAVEATVHCPELALGTLKMTYETVMARCAPDASILAFFGHEAPVVGLAFGQSMEGRLHLASVGYDGQVIRWNPDLSVRVSEPLDEVNNDDQLVQLGTAADGRILSAVRSSDGLRSTSDYTRRRDQPYAVWRTEIHSWEARVDVSAPALVSVTVSAGGASRTHAVDGLGASIRSIAVGPGINGQCLLATGDEDGVLRVWDADTGSAVGPPLPGHNGPILCLAIGTTSWGLPLLASGGRDGSVRLFDPYRNFAQGPDAISGGNRAVAWSRNPTGSTIATASEIGTVRVWDVDGVRSTAKLEVGSSVLSVSFGRTPSGEILASGCLDGTIWLWDATSRVSAAAIEVGEPVGALASGLFRGKGVLASASWDGNVRLFDLATLTQLGDTLECSGWTSYDQSLERYIASVAIAISPDGARRPVLACASDSIYLYELDEDSSAPLPGPRRLQAMGVDTIALGRGLSGEVLLASAERGFLKIRNAETGTLVGDPVGMTGGFVLALSFGWAGDTPILAAACSDRAVLIVDPLRGRVIERIPRRTQPASLAFNSEGALLAVADVEGVTVLRPLL